MNKKLPQTTEDLDIKKLKQYDNSGEIDEIKDNGDLCGDYRLLKSDTWDRAGKDIDTGE